MKSTPLHLELGRLGEKLAADYLIQKGFTIVCTNFRVKGGEIDIIAEKMDHLHFVEVKTVSCENIDDTSNSGFRPEDNIHNWKIKRLKMAINLYLISKGKGNFDLPWQFDVITLKIDSNSKKARINFIKDIIL